MNQHTIPYQWQQQEWTWLKKIYQQNNIPNALLFHGRDHSGLFDLVKMFVQYSLCQKPQLEKDAPCKECKPCRLIENDVHPDLMILKNNKISIDEVRELIAYINTGCLSGTYKFAIIDSLDAMNISGMNALLKTLEEVSKRAIVIVLSYNPQNVPLTIKSRCCEIKFKNPTVNDLKSVLSSEMSEDQIGMLSLISSNRPFFAIDLANNEAHMDDFLKITSIIERLITKQDMSTTTEEMSKYDIDTIVQYLQLIISDVIKLKSGLLNKSERVLSYYNALKNIAERAKISALYMSLDHLAALFRETAILKIKPNKMLMIERIMAMLIQ